jgi:hypothetical protein
MLIPTQEERGRVTPKGLVFIAAMLFLLFAFSRFFSHAAIAVLAVWRLRWAVWCARGGAGYSTTKLYFFASVTLVNCLLVFSEQCVNLKGIAFFILI